MLLLENGTKHDVGGVQADERQNEGILRPNRYLLQPAHLLEFRQKQEREWHDSVYQVVYCCCPQRSISWVIIINKNRLSLTLRETEVQ